MNKEKFTLRTISELYHNGVNIKPTAFSNLTEDDIEKLDAFHASDVMMIELPDEYFCGIRANHFVVEFGWSELDFYDEGENPVNQILITANHKGVRMLTLIDCPKTYS